MSKLMDSNYIVRLLGFSPAKRSEAFLKEKGMYRVKCDSCGGEGWTDGGRCGICGGVGSMFKWIERAPFTW